VEEVEATHHEELAAAFPPYKAVVDDPIKVGEAAVGPNSVVVDNAVVESFA